MVKRDDLVLEAWTQRERERVQEKGKERRGKRERGGKREEKRRGERSDQRLAVDENRKFIIPTCIKALCKHLMESGGKTDGSSSDGSSKRKNNSVKVCFCWPLFL